MAAATAAGAAEPIAELKELSIEQLLDVKVTSVSRTPISLEDAPSALQVITQQDIERSGASSIPDALRLANNLDVAEKNSHDWGISARGFNTDLANKLLVMIDGRTVYTPLFSGVRWDVQDYLLEDIDRIEVVSGPGGTLWGANAVNGVINVTTKSAKDTQGFYGEAGGGNELKDFASARFGGELTPNIYYRVYAKHTERDDEVQTNGVDVNDASQLSQGGFRVDGTTPAKGTVTVQGDYYFGWEGMPGTGDSKLGGGNLLSRWSQALASGSDVRLQAYYDRTYLRQPFAASAFGAAGYFADNLDTFDVDFQYDIKHAENQTLVWGLGWRMTDDRTKDAPSLGFTPVNLRQSLFSGFVQDQWALSKQVIFTAGTKVEHNDYTGFEWEPSIRLQDNLSENQMVWTAISRAVRTPSRVERDIREPSAGLTILGGGLDFDSETVIAYEAGYRAKLGERLVGSLSLFYNDYSHIRSLRATPVTTFPLVFANDLEGETHGLELAFNYDLLTDWRVDGGYTLLEEHLHIRPGGVDLNNALNETSDPQHQVALGSSVDLPHGVTFDAHLRWVDTLHDNNKGKVGTVPAYTELNVRIGWKVSDHVELSLVGENLLDSQHAEFGTPGPTRVEIRRSVYAKVACTY